MIGAQIASRSNQDRSLFLNHFLVVLHRVRLTGTKRLAHLPGDQFLEGLTEVANRQTIHLGHDARRMRQQNIAGQNRHRVIPPRVRRFHTAALVGFVHHVVVIQRRQVHNLHDTSGFVNIYRFGARAIFRRQQRHHRTEALASSLSQVQNLIRDEILTARKLRTQQVFDRFHPGSDARIELFIPQIHSGGVTS